MPLLIALQLHRAGSTGGECGAAKEKPPLTRGKRDGRIVRRGLQAACSPLACPPRRQSGSCVSPYESGVRYRPSEFTITSRGSHSPSEINKTRAVVMPVTGFVSSTSSCSASQHRSQTCWVCRGFPLPRDRSDQVSASCVAASRPVPQSRLAVEPFLPDSRSTLSCMQVGP